MSKDSFNCNACGECCRHIDLVPQLSCYDDGNGVCIHLKDNKCDIYDIRPEICRVDVMYEKEYNNRYTREEFYSLNEQICQRLKLLSKNQNL